jgi:hypothetical protein
MRKPFPLGKPNGAAGKVAFFRKERFTDPLPVFPLLLVILILLVIPLVMIGSSSSDLDQEQEQESRAGG